jgi:predicted HTH transcriptional regulator
LHERAVLALERLQETEDVDFKESAPWDVLKGHIIHSTLGMGNLREGGLIVVGVSERGDEWRLTGIREDDLATYDPDEIASQVNAHVSPFAELDVVLLDYDSKRYLVIGVREFRDTPLICKKNGPDKGPLREGRIFVRLPAPARTSLVTNAPQMHDLLELAAEKRARRFLEASRRVGLVQPTDSAEKFDEELEGL